MNKKVFFTSILSFITGVGLQIFFLLFLRFNKNTYLILQFILGFLNFLTFLLIIFSLKKNGKKQKKREINLDFEHIIDSLSDGIMLINQDKRIQFFNPEAVKITGFSKEDAIGIDYQMFFKLVNSDGTQINQTMNPVLNSIKTSQKILSRDFCISTASNIITPISIVSIPIIENNTVLITFRNIEKELNEEREQLEFISTASHEMRTPIASIEGYLGLASNPKTATVDERAEKYIKKAQDSVDHLGVLFRNLLSISKAEDKRIKVEPKMIDLNKFLKQLTDNYIQLNKKENLKITFMNNKNNSRTKILNPSILTYTDPNILREIMSILVENAIKYTEKGDVKLDLVLNQQGNAQISVSDTGIGIPPENIPHLFQKFYRVDNTATREIGGTGLGLYLARKLTKNIQGQIWAESKLGKGSVFYVSLPRISIEEARKIQEMREKTVMPEINVQSPMSKYQKNSYGNNLDKEV